METLGNAEEQMGKIMEIYRKIMEHVGEIMGFSWGRIMGKYEKQLGFVWEIHGKIPELAIQVYSC